MKRKYQPLFETFRDADPIIVGGRITCPRCGEDYSMADIHQCEIVPRKRRRKRRKSASKEEKLKALAEHEAKKALIPN